jgi:DNA helicase-2/ATP-dependent DNA helicase PcrA
MFDARSDGAAPSGRRPAGSGGSPPDRLADAGDGWDAGLDEAQLQAVLHGEGPLVVVAGAGTGKTRTLTSRLARLLDRGVEPERVLLLTFTRRAADDMLARAAALVGRPEHARRLRGGTFHAVARQVVAANAEALGVPAGFSVLDPGDAADVMDLLREEHGLAGGEVRAPRPATLVDIYSRCVATEQPLAEVLAADFPWCEPHRTAIAGLCRAYVERKRQRGQLDFDDLLLYWRAALGHPSLGPRLAAAYDHVLVDEYQDVNAVQADIVAGLRPDGRGLTVVGDDAQAVYGFRGADARHLAAVLTRHPEATVVRLETNFRSLGPICELANAARPPGGTGPLVLRALRRGGGRPVLERGHDAATEARVLAQAVLDAHQEGVALRHQAVLVRAAHHSDLIELELSARRIPYRKYGGLRFLEAAHVRDLVATLRLLDNPADDAAWLRLLRLHDGVGPARGRALARLLAPAGGDGLGRWAEVVAEAPAASRVALSATFEALDAARDRPDPERPAAVVAFLGPLVAGRYPAAEARTEDLGRLAAAASVVDDLAGWVAELTLDPPALTGELAGPPHLDEDYLVISTVHSAKGLEWPVVHLAHLADGAFPSDMALRSPDGLEEERRLFYVAVTRARDRLALYVPARLPHHRRAADDRHTLVPPSRFLTEAVVGALEVRHRAPPRPAMAPAGPPSGPPAVDLDALWR